MHLHVWLSLKTEVLAWKTFLFFAWSTSYKSSESWEHKACAQGQWQQDNCRDLVPLNYAQLHKSLNCHNLSLLEFSSCLKYSAVAIYERYILCCLCLKCIKTKLKFWAFTLQQVLRGQTGQKKKKHAEMWYLLIWTGTKVSS